MERLAFLQRRLRTAYQQVSYLLPLMLLNVVALNLLFPRPSAAPWAWPLVLAATGLVWFGVGLWGNRPLRTRALVVWGVANVAGALALASEYSWFLAELSAPLSGDQSLVVAVQAAFFGVVGLFALAAVPTASVAWTLGFTPLLMIASSLDSRWSSFTGLAVVITLAGSAAFLVWSSRKGLLSRFRAEAGAAQQGQLVGLLMHEFGEGSLNWTWETDRYGHLRSVSTRLAGHFGLPPEALEGRAFAEALTSDPGQLTIEEDESLQGLADRFTRLETFHDVEVAAQVAGPEHRWRLSGRPLYDDFGVAIGWRGVATDITEAERVAMQQRRSAIIDEVTGLLNRRRLQEILHDRLSPRAGDAPFSLVLVDLRGFRTVNEALGHEVGDQLLRQVAHRLLALVPDGGLLARLGGDEFALLLTGADDAELASVTATLRNAASEPFFIEGHRLEVVFQLGRASAPRDGRGAAELLKCAELALHEAQFTGQGVVAYQSELGRRALDRIRLHRELKMALLEGQFELHYQPQIRVLDSVLAGSEALVRWRHPTRGLVSPADFIPALEESGLIVEVGRWILQEACRQALRWPDHEKVAVNVSAVQFASRTFLESVRAALSSGLKPQRLELEITESVMAQDSDRVVTVLNELREMGIAVALDDFGTGYSSLSYLRQLPLDKLKVDQSFVRVLDVDPNAVAIVQAVLDLARALGLRTTAEGVETEEQRARLSMLGVDQIQGYLYSRPVNAEGLEAFRALIHA